MSIRLPAGPPPPYTPGSSTSIPPPASRGPRRPQLFDLPIFATLRTKRVILASASPRRLTLLSQLPLPTLEIIPSTFSENLPKDLDPFAYVTQTAMEKAMEVYKQEVDKDLLFEGTKGGEGNVERRELGIVIGADTVVVSPLGAILEKPRSEQEHFAMLKQLRDGGEHHVLTGLCVMTPRDDLRVPGYKLETHVEDTKVRFDKTMTDEFLMSYVRTREGCDKAGGYGIQGLGGVLVEGIEGSWDNVVGLPVRWCLKLMEKVLSPDDDEIVSEDEFL